MDLAARAGTWVVPYHNRRWDGDFRTVRQLMAGAILGSLHRFESRYGRCQADSPSGPQRAWKRERRAGAGILYDLGAPGRVGSALVTL